VQYNDKQRRRSKSTNANVQMPRPHRTRTALESEPPLLLRKGFLGELHHTKHRDIDSDQHEKHDDREHHATSPRLRPTPLDGAHVKASLEVFRGLNVRARETSVSKLVAQSPLRNEMEQRRAKYKFHKS
jgi:hypothetical protein